MELREQVLQAIKGKEGFVPWLEIETRDELVAKTLQVNEVGWKERVEYAQLAGIDCIAINHWDRFGNQMISHDGVLGFIPLIKERSDLSKLKFPKLDPQALRQRAREAREAIGDSGLALHVAHPLSFDPIIIDMGFENFCYKLFDDLEFIKIMMGQYTEYYAELDAIYSEMPEIDFIWVGEDVAFNSGPYIRPEQFRELVLPYYHRIVKHITKPWIYHSDGNILPVVDDLLTLGMDALHPFQPDVMDIFALKKTLGQRVTMVGNVDLHLLCTGTPDQVKSQVFKLLEHCSPGGKYILSSSNSLANYVHTDNVLAMGEAKKAWNEGRIGCCSQDAAL